MDNVKKNNAIDLTYDWIKNKHNNRSEEITLGKFEFIYKEIVRQANKIYTYKIKFNNKNKEGIIYKNDLNQILNFCKEDFSLHNFLFEIIKYMNIKSSEDRENGINIYSGFLRLWGGYNYLKKIDQLISYGLEIDRVQGRFKGYSDKKSKIFRINNWQWSNIDPIDNIGGFDFYQICGKTFDESFINNFDKIICKKINNRHHIFKNKCKIKNKEKDKNDRIE
jgi:hypothetical protein